MKNIASFVASVFLPLLFVTSISYAQTPEEELTAVLRDTKKAKTDVVLIYKDGKIIYEYYAREYTPTTKHLSWSTAKTMTGILIGIADSEGLISINDPVKKYFPEIKTSARIIDVLGMSSGIKFKEAFEGLPIDLDLTNMMYLAGHGQGYVSYMINNPLSETGLPGEYFNYSSGDTNLLIGILQKALKNQKVYDNYPWVKLFNPLGIEATFEQDLKNNFVGASYIYMTAPDFLKMGQLIMNKGEWNGRQIIPPKYFDLMNRVADGVQVKVQKGNPENKAYSAQAITNLPIEGRNQASAYKDLPLDAVIMYGFQGQIVVASPSQKLVMVKLSMDEKDFDRDAFYGVTKKFILAKGLPYETVGETTQPVSTWQIKDENPNAHPIASFPHLVRAYTAKEYCSCRFVIGRSDKICRDDLNAIVKIYPEIKVQGDTVTTSILGGLFGQKAIAHYRGKKLGCTLIQSE
jgi:CubicO group peptidase (beta-lactamase class C family)